MSTQGPKTHDAAARFAMQFTEDMFNAAVRQYGGFTNDCDQRFDRQIRQAWDILASALMNRYTAPPEAGVQYRHRAEIKACQNVPTDLLAKLDVMDLLRTLAAYSRDETRYLEGEGEPFGLISTEDGILARGVAQALEEHDAKTGEPA